MRARLLRIRDQWRRDLRRLAARARRTTSGPVNAAQGVWDDVVDWFNGLEFNENGILLGFAVLIGVGAALGAIGFYKLIDLAHRVFFSLPESLLPSLGLLAYRPVLTAAGAVVAWYITARFARGNDGMNIPDLQRAVLRRHGEIPTRPAVARTAASAVTIGSGGSAGSEGPVAVFGALIASRLSALFRFSGNRTRILVGAGAAAGISAAFNAPLAGAFFALEEILGSFSTAAFAPVVVSSVVAAVVSRSVFGNHPVFPVPLAEGYTLTREVALFYPLLGLVTGLVSVFFVRCYFWVDGRSRAVRLPPAWLAAGGGALVGGLAFLSGGLLVGAGHLAIPLDRFRELSWYLLALLALGKIVATSITLNTGGSGGLLTPSLFVGASVGAAFGSLVLTLFPGLHLSAEPYALVGMGAVIAAATNAPMTGIFMVWEMTGNSAIILPLMLSVVVSHAVARRLEQDSLYSGWLRRRGEHIEHGADRDVLSGLRVDDAFDRKPAVIPGEAPASQFLTHLGSGSQDLFPVVDEQGTLLGVLTVPELARISREDRDRHPTILARQVVLPSETLQPGDSLLEAMRRMGARGAGALPVVDPAEQGRFVGLLSQGDVWGLYERILAGAPDPPTASPGGGLTPTARGEVVVSAESRKGSSRGAS
ncbi:MAG TPA: chloride channel protein [Gemmatimonadales bacterium]|nr:chloride channel protein [Gemmatimonadales bacterium]